MPGNLLLVIGKKPARPKRVDGAHIVRAPGAVSRGQSRPRAMYRIVIHDDGAIVAAPGTLPAGRLSRRLHWLPPLLSVEYPIKLGAERVTVPLWFATRLIRRRHRRGRLAVCAQIEAPSATVAIRVDAFHFRGRSPD